MPSSRALAADLGIARSTVVAAYEQLSAEGYVRARQGQSTVVADVAEIARPDTTPDETSDHAKTVHDFRPGEPTTGSFPRREWVRSVRKVMREAPDGAFGYGDPRGCTALRSALASYLARARMAHVDASAVRVYAGFASSLGFVGEMLRLRGVTRIGVEQPMLFYHRQILELVGLETVPVPVDAEGLSVYELARSNVGAVMVTPANQQPLGITMSSQRRSDLVGWARGNDAWILEDDYDGEFRYDRRPIGALQGLDAERVLYAGTASKTMGPGLHLSWLVVPPELRRDLAHVTHLRAGVSTINQLAFADLIGRGAYDRHIRQQRRTYQQRRKVLIERLRSVRWVDVSAADAGMHLVARIVDGGIQERSLIEAGRDASIKLTGLQTHFEHSEAGIVLNVARPADHQFEQSVDELLRLLADQSRA